MLSKTVIVLVCICPVILAASIDKRDEDIECTTSQALQYGINCRRKRAALEARSGADYNSRNGLIEKEEELGGADYQSRRGGLEDSDEQGADYERRSVGKRSVDEEEQTSIRNMLKY